MFKGVKLTKENQNCTYPPKNDSKYNDLKIIIATNIHNWIQQKSIDYHNASVNKDEQRAKLIE